MVQCCFTSTETVRLIRTEGPGRPPRLLDFHTALKFRTDHDTGAYFGLTLLERVAEQSHSQEEAIRVLTRCWLSGNCLAEPLWSGNLLGLVLVVGRVQELCESRGGRPGLSALMSLTVSVDVKRHRTVPRHWSQFVPNTSPDIRGHEALLHHHLVVGAVATRVPCTNLPRLPKRLLATGVSSRQT